MLNFFSRPTQKKSFNILTPNTPPQAALESGRDGLMTQNHDTSMTHSNDAFMTAGEGIKIRIKAVENILIGMPMVCVMCQSITPKTKATKLCCSHRCRQRLYIYRQERSHWTHYIFNSDGSIMQLNRWHKKHIAVDQLYDSTVALGKHIHQMTKGEMISIETLEAIKRQLNSQ